MAGALVALGGVLAPLGAGANDPPAGSSAAAASSGSDRPAADVEREQSLDLARMILDRRAELAPRLQIGDPTASTSAPLRVGTSRWTPADLRALFPDYVRMARPDDPRSTRSLTLFRTKMALEDLLAARAAAAGVDQDPELLRLLELRANQVIAEYYLRRHVLDELTVTPSEIEDYYAAHPDEFTDPPRLTVGLIVTESPAEAEEAKRRLDAGASFEAVAAELSIHTSRQRGGVLPPATRGKLDPDLEAIAWEQEPGAVAGPVQLAGRWYLVRTIDLQPPRVQPLDEVRAALFKRLYDAKRQQTLEATARALMADEDITLFEVEEVAGTGTGAGGAAGAEVVVPAAAAAATGGGD